MRANLKELQCHTISIDNDTGTQWQREKLSWWHIGSDCTQERANHDDIQDSLQIETSGCFCRTKAASSLDVANLQSSVASDHARCSNIDLGVANVPSHAFKKIPPTASQGGRSSFNFSGKWYGGGGTYTISQQAINVVIRSEGEYSTTWAGIVSGNKINGSWSCSRANQKGTFSFTYNPNYQKGYMERISGTYYIEDKWGKDPRDFYADRKIQR